ncbi:TldD/PmbA family protein [Phormidium sp. CCY1219]|uniref:TldD/PmbA family protein n=1 Tax=Phormidium sp. CCY1219 TaxID=2886104 RepID=UPI002D1F2601|nr:TldD/PmbA family protein [Phormidium sp. CCY1219]
MGSEHLQAEELAEKLLEIAKKSGAEEAEIFQSKAHSRPVYFEANRLKQLESTQSEGTALRVWKNGRPGIAVAYGPVEPQMLVDRALALSELNQPEIIELTENKAISYEDIGENISSEQLVEWGKEAIALVRDAYPEIICNGEWECESETTRVLNSKGLHCSYKDTTLSGYLSAEWVRGDDFLSVSDGQIQRGTLQPTEIAEQILQRLAWSKENVPAVSGGLPILFTAKAADMLWGTLQAAVNGKRVKEQSSPWSDRIGQLVTSEKLTISQQPTAGPYSCPFDDEGTPTQTITFIHHGMLQNFYCDRTTGRLLGIGTTGNGFRPSLGSYPTPGLFNWYIEPGSHSLSQLIAQLEEGLIVDQILGGGAGISGDFSINVDLGFRVKNGEIIGRVKDTMVAGNVYTAVKELVEIGADAEWNGSCYTPSLILSGLYVTGKNQSS